MTDAIRHLVPSSSENRWSDLLAAMIEEDPICGFQTLGLGRPQGRVRVTREARASGRDRVDMLVLDDEVTVAAIEAKLLSGVTAGQLERYAAAFPDSRRLILLFLRRLPLSLPSESGWEAATWDAVLDEFASSENAWVAQTCQAWRNHLDRSVPKVDADTLWGELRPGEDFVLAIRARMAWVYGHLNPPQQVQHDFVPSSAGVSWIARMTIPTKKSGYLVRVEAEEAMPVRSYPKLASSASPPRGPDIKVCLVQQGVHTSRDFDWDYLLELWKLMEPARSDWSGSPRPKAAHDREGVNRIRALGAPRSLGIGFGDAQARRRHECMFGARFHLPAAASLKEIAAELNGVGRLLPVLADLDPDQVARE